jgi:peroxiredoxin
VRLPLAAAFAFLLAALSAGGQAPPPPKGSASKQVADFTLPDLEGRPVSLAAFQGKTAVLLAFVKGTWCPHCVDLILQLQKLKATDLSRIPVLVISPEPATQTLGFLTKLQTERGSRLSMTFLVDTALRFAPRYGLTREVSGSQGRPPNVVLLDPGGRQVWYWAEGHDRNLEIGPSLHARIEEIRALRASTPPPAAPTPP